MAQVRHQPGSLLNRIELLSEERGDLAGLTRQKLQQISSFASAELLKVLGPSAQPSEEQIQMACQLAYDVFVAGYSFTLKSIDLGYENSFIVLDSELISIEHHEQDPEWIIIRYEYLYVNMDGLKNHYFDKYCFSGSRVTFDKHEFIQAGGIFIDSGWKGDLCAIEIDDYVRGEELVVDFLKRKSSDEIEEKLFGILIDRYFFDENSFDVTGCWDGYDDIRVFLEDACATLKSIDDNTFNIEQADEWWSHLRERLCRPGTLSMFQRLLRVRLQRLKEAILEVDNEQARHRTFDIMGDQFSVAINPPDSTVSNERGAPFLITELVCGRGGSMRADSLQRQLSRLEESGCSILQVVGVFAGSGHRKVSLVDRIDFQSSETLVQMTSCKIGIWVSAQGDTKIINRVDYFSPYYVDNFFG